MDAYQELIDRIEKSDNKWIVFEHFAKYWFLTSPRWKRLKHVWMLDEIPKKVRKELSLPERDVGIDLLLEDRDYGYIPVQVKYRSADTITYGELGTFLALCGNCRLERMIVFTNADQLSGNTYLANQNRDLILIGSGELMQSGNELLEHISRLLFEPGEFLYIVPKFTPRPYQEDIILAAIDYYTGEDSSLLDEDISQTEEDSSLLSDDISQTEEDSSLLSEDISQYDMLDRPFFPIWGSDRSNGRIYMPCGTGKSLIAMWICQQLGKKRICVVVPSLFLLSQIHRVWNEQGHFEGFAQLLVVRMPIVTIVVMFLLLRRKKSGILCLNMKRKISWLFALTSHRSDCWHVSRILIWLFWTKLIGPRAVVEENLPIFFLMIGDRNFS